MTPADVPPRLEREYGCTVDEWRGWLPQAVGRGRLQITGEASATVGLRELARAPGPAGTPAPAGPAGPADTPDLAGPADTPAPADRAGPVAPQGSPGPAPEPRLLLAWAPLPIRQIALVRLPRLQVRFAFEDCDNATRYAFLRAFDLYLQRGGG